MTALLRVTVGLYTLTIPVTVTDTRTAFGRPESLVTPIAGSGEAWVSTSRLTPVPPRFEPSQTEVDQLDAEIEATQKPA